MAFLEFRYFSKAIRTSVTVNVILPEVGKTEEGVGRVPWPYKTVWLLHGLNGNQNSWVENTSIERYARERGLAVVMPCADRSWYTDTAYGAKYFTFVSEELPVVCRSYFQGMSDKREDNLVIGLSMGGYGALKCALTHPERYGAVAALSGALDITRKGRPYSPEEWRGIFGFELKSALELENTRHDLFYLTRENRKNALPFPKTYLWCGTEDALIAVNRTYRDLLTELDIPHLYEESPGTHTWKYWDEKVVNALNYLLDE
ncbi:MAG: esterase family protein [Ruminococcaceae bacterium]|nr:esterase family protein [Oscillospiraceae bacterium]